MTWDVIVIGAGLAGLSCARSLHQLGYRVLVLEKSRGLGGRLATRRIDADSLDSVAVDHGCRFLQPTTPLLQQLIADLHRQEVLTPWQPQVYQLEPDGSLSLSPPCQHDLPLFVAPTGMTAVAKQLAHGLEIRRQTRATALNMEGDAQWRVISASPTGQQTAVAQCVVLAIPAPQAANLLQKTETAASWRSQLQTSYYEPCFSLMVGFAPDSPIGPAHEGRGWMVWGHSDSAIAWAGLDSAKPGRCGQTVVLQSSAAFARRHLDSQDLAPAAEHLLAAAAPIWGALAPRWQQIHRWRYSQVARPAGGKQPAAPVVPIRAALPLYCCGDWCWGNDAGAALFSGQTAAHDVHGRLQKTD